MCPNENFIVTVGQADAEFFLSLFWSRTKLLDWPWS